MNTVKVNSSSALKSAFLLAASCLLLNSPAHADEEFYGTVESRPTQNAGVWIVNGQQLEVTDKTEIDQDDGPLIVGSCVEVEHKKGVVKELESVKSSKCGKK
ncbi:MAG: DUF5666 domain-containing protein [Methylotenera sp.]|uniref:DUF5666 domain-containing protein n=1 Tax=Methylotenera sp. TaxID=2051956 RepID=UPI0024889A14|nr:DUF5666 domain-containing protein [Methylotenera sp.]MDI1309660.1 DUF5666 domain-containing protein [Methylotenera sp.]